MRDRSAQCPGAAPRTSPTPGDLGTHGRLREGHLWHHLGDISQVTLEWEFWVGPAAQEVALWGGNGGVIPAL